MSDEGAAQEEDAAVHFHLASAYREMGLVDEALRDFEIAARDPRFRLEALMGVAACWAERGSPGLAIQALRKALAVARPGSAERRYIAFRLAELGGQGDDDDPSGAAVRSSS